MKNVLIIAAHYMGYVQKIARNLRKNKTVDVTDIHIPSFKYKSISTKILNFFLKIISKDIKFNYRENYINKIIGNENYDIILIVRPDLLAFKTLEQLKSRTPLFKVYFFDGINHYPRKLKRLKFFDEIFSFEPNDCKKYYLRFATTADLHPFHFWSTFVFIICRRSNQL